MNEQEAKALARSVADPDTVDPVHSGKPDFVVLTVREFIAATEKYAAEQVAAEREACAKTCEARYMGDNNREDMEARRCAAAIRARAQEQQT